MLRGHVPDVVASVYEPSSVPSPFPALFHPFLGSSSPTVISSPSPSSLPLVVSSGTAVLNHSSINGGGNHIRHQVPQQPHPHHHHHHHHHHHLNNIQTAATNHHQHHQQPQRNPFIVLSQCLVCGDRARGCNFGAITCASCKEFFRRNAFKLNKLKCYFQSKCDIHVYSRRFCAACRLAKCYHVGMKSDYIMSEAEKNERNQKINERKSKICGVGESHKSSVSPVAPKSPSSYSECEYYHVSRDKHHHDSPFGHNNINNQSSLPVHGTELKVKEESNSEDSFRTNDCSMSNDDCNWFKLESHGSDRPIDSLDSVSAAAAAAASQEEDPETFVKLIRKVRITRESSYSVQKFHLFVRAQDIGQQLTEHGSCRLKYLTSIVQILSAETITSLPTEQRYIDLIDIAEIVTYNFIKMCKKINVFHTLSQDDQVALVKGGVMDSLMIWSMMTINLEKECWEVVDVERNFRFSLKLEMLKETNPKLYEKHRQYLLSFEPEWRCDDNLMSLLIAIALFNPNQPDLTDVKMIADEHNSYCNLLKLYLATLYEKSAIQKTYERLLGQLELTKTISEYHMKAYFDVSAKEVTKNGFGGLIMETFDLKKK